MRTLKSCRLTGLSPGGCPVPQSFIRSSVGIQMQTRCGFTPGRGNVSSIEKRPSLMSRCWRASPPIREFTVRGAETAEVGEEAEEVDDEEEMEEEEETEEIEEEEEIEEAEEIEEEEEIEEAEEIEDEEKIEEAEEEEEGK
ncbi:unnamed protein product [Pleuronectes platessa]|uniref:Uncharacterized protein n=1 Tax=Pleuronectes platessa TaxID=8262 RepID=A0A9N7Y5D1_PLEPL|nr:unnamed protein product [Pleuronectes platessa]